MSGKKETGIMTEKTGEKPEGRKHRSKKVSESRDEYDNLYEALAKSSQVGVYIAQGGKFKFVNPYIVNYSGYREDEWIGRNTDHFLLPEDVEKTRQNARAMLTGKRWAPYEYRYVTKSGETRWIMENIISVTYKGKRAVLGNTMDITEEREAKAKLAETENLYRSFVNNTQTGVFVAQAGKIKFANPHLLAYTKCEKMEELIDKNIIEFVHPEDRKAASESARQMLRGKRSYPYEYRMLTKDGSSRWILETVTPIEYFGEPAIMGSSIDMTELVETKKHLVEVRALESTLLAAMPHAVIGLENRRIIFASDSVKNVFGWEPQEVIGKTTRIFYRSDEDFDIIGKRFYPSLEHRKTYSEIFPCRKKDGTNIECMVNTARFGEVLKDMRIVVVYEDMTEQKRAERALRESEEKYASLVEQAMDGIIIIQDESCLFANKAMAAMSGYEVGELTGMPFAELFVDQDRDIARRLHRIRMAGEASLPLYEGRLLCKDGSIKDVEIAFGIISIEEKKAEMGYVRDITFRKKAQEEIRRTVERLKK
ncbi:MAG: PAS domain S-box protein, partial [Syntrophales bacterium]|nr:PAS domain S-box protein [Syntrophales bacterium]